MECDAPHMDTTPYWLSTGKAPSFPTLAHDLEVEVLVVGGGITGVTTAYLLACEGVKVALLERGRICEGETGHTTAHVSYVTDERLSELVKTFGRDHARAGWEAGAYAMDTIKANVRREAIQCDFGFAPAFLFAEAGGDTEREAEKLREEAKLAVDLGFAAEYVSSAPVVKRPAIRFANQMKFHPRKYVTALAERVAAKGGHVFEKSEVTEFQDSPRQAKSNGHKIRYSKLVISTHVPLQGLSGTASAALLQTKLAGYSTYAVGAKLPPGTLPQALFWDTGDPYLYLRIDRRKDCDYLILGGEDHKTGQVSDTEDRYRLLEKKLLGLFPNAEFDALWSGQVIKTNDGLPFIGETAEGQFISTGFGGNGITFGTVAAVMAKDYVMGIANPWADLFRPERKKLSAVWDYLKENKDYPYYFLSGQFAADEESGLASLGKGEGCVIRRNGKMLAIHREKDGNLTSLSAVCPHLGCTVVWNPAESTWDCPCHGSRFMASGEVITGPAESGLEKAPSK